MMEVRATPLSLSDINSELILPQDIFTCSFIFINKVLTLAYPLPRNLSKPTVNETGEGMAFDR